MAATHSIIFKFLSLYQGGNSIGEKGCEYLSKTQWPLLTELDLSYSSFIKMEIILKRKDAII